MTCHRFCLSLVFALPLWSGQASAALLPPVTVNGVEWLQPLDFVSLGWNAISAVCDPDSGACTGTLGGHDLTGWTWGGIDALLAMTSAFTGQPPGEISSGLNSAWAPLFLQSFSATDVDPGRSMVSGILRERQPLPDGIVFHGLFSVTDAHQSPFVDSVSITPTGGAPGAQSTLGAWFYRDSRAAVPAPATLGLLALSLVILTLPTRILERKKTSPL